MSRSRSRSPRRLARLADWLADSQGRLYRMGASSSAADGAAPPAQLSLTGGDVATGAARLQGLTPSTRALLARIQCPILNRAAVAPSDAVAPVAPPAASPSDPLDLFSEPGPGGNVGEEELHRGHAEDRQSRQAEAMRRSYTVAIGGLLDLVHCLVRARDILDDADHV